MTTTTGEPTYLTIDEVADLLRVPVRTLYYWRTRGTGPAAYRIGRALRYRSREVEAWVDKQAAPRAVPRKAARS